MTLGGSILNKYGGLPEPPEPDPDTPRRAWLGFGVGLLVLVGASAWAYAEPATGRYALGGLSVLIAGGFAASRLYCGWEEDGLFGMVWAWRYPLGWEFAGDRRSPLLVAWAILSVLSVAAASMINGAWP